MPGRWIGIVLACLVLTTLGRSALAEGADAGRDEAEMGRIEGLVTYSGPLLDPILVSEAGTSRHLIEVDDETGGLQDAVVWLDDAPAPDERAKPPDAQMDQRNYFFIPHVLTVETGQAVEFLNNDAPNHAIQTLAVEPANRFNVMTPPGGSYRHRFIPAERPIRVRCPIHQPMGAWIFVFEHPYHTVTDAKGRFALPPVPPGRYLLRVRHPNGGMRAEQVVEVHDTEQSRVTIAFDEEDLKPVIH